MIYYIYLGALVIGTLLVFIAGLKVKTERAPYLKILSHLMYISAISGVAYIIATFSPYQNLAMVGFFFYHILSTWRNLLFFLFSIAYVNSAPLRGYKLYLLYVVAVIDTCMHAFFTFVMHHEFYMQIDLGSGSVWAVSSQTPVFSHVIVSTIFILMFVINLARHYIIDPTIYKMQFAVLIGSMVITIGVNNILRITDIPLDFSALIFGFLAASMSYLTQGFIARALVKDMNSQVIFRSNMAILLFGEHGRCMYINDNASQMFPDMKLTMERDYFEQKYFDNANIESITGTTVYFKEDTAEETCYLFEFNDLHDKKGRFEGSYFLFTDLTSEEKQKRERLLMVSRDYLTGLLNESGFYEKVNRILSRISGEQYQMVISNIAEFKLVNELLGRNKGDQILKSIGEYINQYVNKDVAASRLEADHFAIFMPKSVDVNKYERDINEILRKASSSLLIESYFGVYDEMDTSLSVPMMCENANMALDVFEEDSDEKISYYNKAIRENILTKNEMIAELEIGLRNKQFELYFQPQVDSFSEKVVGAEALVRWNHPTRGFLTPYYFVELFEKHGHILELDKYVWEEACRILKQLRDEGYPISISVNISPKDIFAENIHQCFIDLIEKYELKAEYLKLEITESAAILDIKIVKNFVKRLQDSGFIVEMDDFGSGYSSLNSLKDIPVNIIKTDRYFLMDTEDQERSRHIFDSILALARKLGSPIIAEGVEKIEQLEYLRSIGCHNIQGYYYSPPINLESFKKFMDEHGVDSIKL